MHMHVRVLPAFKPVLGHHVVVMQCTAAMSANRAGAVVQPHTHSQPKTDEQQVVSGTTGQSLTLKSAWLPHSGVVCSSAGAPSQVASSG